MIHSVELPETEISKKEVLRYAGCKDEHDIAGLFEECITMTTGQLASKACYLVSDFSIIGNRVVFPFAETESELLSGYLKGSKKAIVFACTLGSDIDRLILKYSKLSPSRALMLQAIGAERIESLADSLEALLKGNFIVTKPRISPGYGDWAVDCQKQILEVLQANKHLGISLNASMLMSPTKSITAIIATDGDIKNEIS